MLASELKGRDTSVRSVHTSRQRLLVFVGCALASVPAPARERGADGRFDSRSSTHFVLSQDVDLDVRSGPRGSRAFERAVLDVLEEGYDQLDDLLGLRPLRKIEVVVYDPIVFERTFGGRFRFPAAGFYGGSIHVRGGTTLDARLRSTLHHELVHAAFDAEVPSAALPAWLNEGLAEWFAARLAGRELLDRDEAAWLSRLGAEGRLPPIESSSLRSFARLDGDGAAVAYAQSRALVAEIVRIGGERAPGELVERLVRTGDVDRSLDRTVGLDAAGLGASMLDTLGVPR
jgi:hypothetical protein